MFWSRSKKNDTASEDIDVEENGSLGEEVDAAVNVEEDHDDGIFVTESGRKRRSSVTKAITCAAVGLAVAGTAFATGYGIKHSIRSAAQGSENPEDAGVAAYSYAPTYRPTYSPTAAETDELADILEYLAQIEEEALPVDLFLSMSMPQPDDVTAQRCCNCSKASKKSKSKGSKGSKKRALQEEDGRAHRALNDVPTAATCIACCDE